MIITDKNLGMLALVAAIMLIITLVMYSGGYTPQINFEKGAPLIQGLDPAQVATVKLNQAGLTVTLLSDNDKGFTIEERGNYPADKEKVRKLLLDCLNVKCGELVTEEVKNHASFHVLADSSEGITIRFLDKDGKTLAGMVVGKYAEREGGSYVRLLEQDAVYLSETSFAISASAMSYLNTKFFDFKETEIASVLVDRGAQQYAVLRDNAGELKLKDPPEGQRGKDYDLKNIFRSIESLVFKDVAPTGKIEITWNSTVEVTLKNGASYNIRFGVNANEDHLIQVKAGKPQATVEIPPNATEEELKEKNALIDALTAANEFNRLHDGWDYEISKWTTQKICKPLSEILEKAPEAPAPEPEATAGEAETSDNEVPE
ncbi:MAG: DUF4340 domain-containing protein [Planctomycetes bacterium]|nr:DUF4340 domain-containing protein [Planctomycetota bacterium]